ncbi:DeoR/GlpR family DNA-binding transcription regulator [Curtobacterium sp. 24E2]
MAKAAIGRAAAALVRSGECVVLDVGTTPAAVAEALVARTELSDVTVVTNSLTTALALERAVPRFTVIVTGGTLRPLQHSLVAPFNNTLLPVIAADVVFLGGTGVDVAHGLTNVNLPETEAKRVLAATARRTVVVADGSKFGRAHIGVVRALEDIDVVVTAEAEADAVATIRAAGVEVVVADGEDTAGRNHTP